MCFLQARFRDMDPQHTGSLGVSEQIILLRGLLGVQPSEGTWLTALLYWYHAQVHPAHLHPKHSFFINHHLMNINETLCPTHANLCPIRMQQLNTGLDTLIIYLEQIIMIYYLFN